MYATTSLLLSSHRARFKIWLIQFFVRRLLSSIFLHQIFVLLSLTFISYLPRFFVSYLIFHPAFCNIFCHIFDLPNFSPIVSSRSCTFSCRYVPSYFCTSIFLSTYFSNAFFCFIFSSIYFFASFFFCPKFFRLLHALARISAG